MDELPSLTELYDSHMKLKTETIQHKTEEEYSNDKLLKRAKINNLLF